MSGTTISEAEFTEQIRTLAEMYGWRLYHPYDSRRSRAGWPDLVLWHPHRGELIYRELKTETGRLRPAQRTTIDELRRCGADVEVWRPSQLQEIAARLGPRSECAEGVAAGRRARQLAVTPPPTDQKDSA